MLELYGQVKNGRLIYPPNADELYMRLLNKCEGKFLRVRISRVGPQKTQKQLGAYFGLAVARIREKMIEHGWTICGVVPNQQMIHEILSMSCGGVGPHGEVKRVSKMTIDEMVQFFQNVKEWAWTQLGADIPEPDPNWRDKEE